mmetsp:Transcript_31144/g.45589  ORF Transcript_31144/g.45589 Transcript_31144/m.45589 type:complete len:80 (+) Transcript_31144:1759-1998(+)
MTAGILGTILSITATSLDDAVRFVPWYDTVHLQNNPSLLTRILHGTIFVLLTLNCLVILRAIISLALEKAVIHSTSSGD